MPRDITHDLPAAHGMPHQGNLAEVKLFDNFTQIIRQGVVVIAASRIVRTPKPALVVRHAAKTPAAQINHLVLPQRGVSRPTVNKEDRLSSSPFRVKQHGVVPGFDEWPVNNISTRRSSRAGTVRPDTFRIAGNQSRAGKGRCKPLQEISSIHKFLLDANK